MDGWMDGWMDGCEGAWFEDALAIEGQKDRFSGKKERMGKWKTQAAKRTAPNRHQTTKEEKKDTHQNAHPRGDPDVTLRVPSSVPASPLLLRSP
jgi:hypothetical protein